MQGSEDNAMVAARLLASRLGERKVIGKTPPAIMLDRFETYALLEEEQWCGAYRRPPSFLPGPRLPTRSLRVASTTPGRSPR